MLRRTFYHQSLLPTNRVWLRGDLSIVLHGFVSLFPVLLHRRYISRRTLPVVLLFSHRPVNHTSTPPGPILHLPKTVSLEPRNPPLCRERGVYWGDGGPSQCLAISSHHFSWTFSSESRDSTLKRSIMTC